MLNYFIACPIHISAELLNFELTIIVYALLVYYFIAPAPEFAKVPLSQKIPLTQSVTFTCYATGYNINYRWTTGSGSFPSKVTGINTNTLVIPDVRSSDDNTYTCVASNEGGIISSHPARLEITGMTIIIC